VDDTSQPDVHYTAVWPDGTESDVWCRPAMADRVCALYRDLGAELVAGREED